MNRQKIASIVLSAAILSGAAATQANNVVHASNSSVSAVSTNNKVGTVSAPSGLNVRISSSTSAKILSSLANNTKVNIIGEQGGWYKVQVGNTTGYVSKDYIKVGTVATSNRSASNTVSNSPTSHSSTSTSTGKIGTVSAPSGLNVIISPSTSARVINSLANNTKVNIIGEQSGWYKVQAGSTTGYVSKDYIKAGSTSTQSKSTPVSNSSIAATNKATNNIPKIGTISVTTGLNVRVSPSTSATVLTALGNNTKVSVLGEQNGWYKIQVGRVTGYVAKQYVKLTIAAGSTAVSHPSTTTSGTVSHATPSVSSKTGTISVSSGLNVRVSPSTSAKILTALGNNTKVTVLGEQNGWYRIQAGGVTGYVSKQYVKLSAATTSTRSTAVSHPTTTSAVVTRTGTVNVRNALNVRKGSNINSQVVGTLKAGTRVTILGEENGWYKIKLNNSFGYVSKAFIK